MVSSLAPGHRQAVMTLAGELVLLHPVRQEYRTGRGERHWRVIGFGVMREHGPQTLADGALASRAAIAKELAVQRSHLWKTEEKSPDEPKR